MGMRKILVKRKRHILSIFLSFVSGIIVGYMLSNIPILSGVAPWIGGSLTFGWLFNVIYGVLKEARQQEKEEKIKKEKIKKKINDKVFKKWKNVSVSDPYTFHIMNIMKEWIDPYLLEKGKDFLKHENDQTREMLDFWNQIDENLENSLTFEYNKIGKRITEKILGKLHDAFPSLQSKEERFVEIKDSCYVTDNIVGFVESNLMRRFLRNEPVNWKKVLEKQFYSDVSIWSLNCHGVCIQSKEENDVDKKYFQNVMETLVESIAYDLKQLNECKKKIDKNVKDFKNMMNHLSIDIDFGTV